MTKPKYDTSSVRYIDENKENKIGNYIDVIDNYYFSCSKLAKKIGISSRKLQYQIEKGKYNLAFQYFFKQSIRIRKEKPDSKIGDLIGYPGRGGEKYISSQLKAVILECKKHPDLLTYFNNQEKLKVKDGDLVTPAFFNSKAEYEMNIKDELEQLKENVKEQERNYTNEYRRKLINKLIDIINDNNLSKEKIIEQILNLGKKKTQRIKFSNETNKTIATLKEDINNLLVDYEAACVGLELEPNNEYPYWIDALAGKSWKDRYKIPALAGKCIRIVGWA